MVYTFRIDLTEEMIGLANFAARASLSKYEVKEDPLWAFSSPQLIVLGLESVPTSYFLITEKVIKDVTCLGVH